MHEENKQDRREATRVPVDFDAVDVLHGTMFHATDLSLSGARLEAGEDRAPGSSLDLEIMLGGGQPIRVRGIVAGSNGGRLHVRFQGLRRSELVRIAESLW